MFECKRGGECGSLCVKNFSLSTYFEVIFLVNPFGSWTPKLDIEFSDRCFFKNSGAGASRRSYMMSKMDSRDILIRKTHLLVKFVKKRRSENFMSSFAVVVPDRLTNIQVSNKQLYYRVIFVYYNKETFPDTVSLIMFL